MRTMKERKRERANSEYQLGEEFLSRPSRVRTTQWHKAEVDLLVHRISMVITVVIDDGEVGILISWTKLD